jgi:hypothetical protein
MTEQDNRNRNKVIKNELQSTATAEEASQRGFIGTNKKPS